MIRRDESEMPLVFGLWIPRHCYAFVTNSDAVLHLKWSGIIDTTARGGEERGQSLQRHGQAGTTAGRPVWVGQARPPQKAEIAATFSVSLSCSGPLRQDGRFG